MMEAPSSPCDPRPFDERRVEQRVRCPRSPCSFARTIAAAVLRSRPPCRACADHVRVGDTRVAAAGVKMREEFEKRRQITDPVMIGKVHWVAHTQALARTHKQGPFPRLTTGHAPRVGHVAGKGRQQHGRLSPAQRRARKALRAWNLRYELSSAVLWHDMPLRLLSEAVPFPPPMHLSVAWPSTFSFWPSRAAVADPPLGLLALSTIPPCGSRPPPSRSLLVLTSTMDPSASQCSRSTRTGTSSGRRHRSRNGDGVTPRPVHCAKTNMYSTFFFLDFFFAERQKFGKGGGRGRRFTATATACGTGDDGAREKKGRATTSAQERASTGGCTHPPRSKGCAAPVSRTDTDCREPPFPPRHNPTSYLACTTSTQTQETEARLYTRREYQPRPAKIMTKARIRPMMSATASAPSKA